MGVFNIRYKIIFPIIIIVIFISLSCVNASENTTDISDNALNDFSTLDLKINETLQTKTLNLNRDYIYNPENDNGYSDGIIIKIDNLVIDGQGHSINANGKSRIFNIQSDNVVLKNLVILNGHADSSGGAVYWNGENGRIIDCVFQNSKSTYSGGAVYMVNPTIITNSKFINNSASFGGGIDLESESIVENCEFRNNYAKFLGGGIYSVEQGKVLNSLFTQNEGGDGGGIYYFSTGLVENTTFEKNIAIGYGGAITNENTVTIKCSKFIENVGAYAGAIFLKGDGIIDNSTFNENSAKSGGAISSYCTDASVLNSEFNYNKAQIGGSLEIISKNVKLENLTFNNDNSSYKSEIYMECLNPALVNVSFNNITRKPTETPDNVVKPITKKKTAITAKAKTFKVKSKIKKYAITLKSGKTSLKNKRITLKLNGKTYSAMTNKKGQAIFKLKITKKGKFKATIKFGGDKQYKSTSKTVYIKIKK